MAGRVNCEEERRELQGYQSIREYLARILMGRCNQQLEAPQ